MASKNQKGKRTFYGPEKRKAVIDAVESGMKPEEARDHFGISSTKTIYQWLSRERKAERNGKGHRRGRKTNAQIGADVGEALVNAGAFIPHADEFSTMIDAFDRITSALASLPDRESRERVLRAAVYRLNRDAT